MAWKMESASAEASQILAYQKPTTEQLEQIPSSIFLLWKCHNRDLASSVKVQLVICWPMDPATSVTRLGDSLHFGQLFKAGGSNFLPKAPTLLGCQHHSFF